MSIRVEVIYALPGRHELVTLSVDEGTTVDQALAQSGLLDRFPEIAPGKDNKIGIYAKVVKGDTVLSDGDRIEIYRPLIADPKAVRRKRAAEGKVMKKGGGDGAEVAGG